jgi:hypothetical protein
VISLACPHSKGSLTGALAWNGVESLQKTSKANSTAQTLFQVLMF